MIRSVKKLALVLTLLLATTTTNGQDISSFVNKWIGKPYRYGGESEKGIDCSALVQRFYKDVYGITIPRTSKMQLTYATIVEKKHLQLGDILFFTSSTSPSGRHVGIYIGNDEFLHASNYKDGVKISCLEDYTKTWKKVGRFTNKPYIKQN